MNDAQARRGAGRTTCRRRALLWSLVVAVLLALAWSARVTLLTGLADVWIVADAPVAADAVVVLGGGMDTRPFAAAEYYKAGLVRKVLVSDVRHGRTERIGVLDSQYDQTRRVLLALGVPAAAIEPFGSGNRNTREEATALRAWVDRATPRRLLVPTEIFSTRRVRWVMGQALAGAAVEFKVPVVTTEDYGRDDWWQRDLGLIAFQNEVLKTVFYRFKYRDWPAAHE